MQNIILASQSPRRKQLLEWAKIAFEVITKTTGESYPDELSHQEAAIHIARNKAWAVKEKVKQEYHAQYVNKTILAADTIVVLENRIIGKPEDRADAIRILTSLAGNHHKVITGVVILNGDKEIAFAEITDVEFHPLTSEQIEYYIDNYLPYDKAGAYAIQEWIGVIGIKNINGDFYNVMGLPVSRVHRLLQQL